jgi:hypothetical protein
MYEAKTSIVADRVAFLEGKKVTVRVWWATASAEPKDSADSPPTPDSPSGPHVFSAVFESIVPLGREYFFVLRVDGRRSLIRTGSVLEMTEAE